jgi:GT2 family glycosyltransferase
LAALLARLANEDDSQLDVFAMLPGEDDRTTRLLDLLGFLRDKAPVRPIIVADVRAIGQKLLEGMALRQLSNLVVTMDRGFEQDTAAAQALVDHLLQNTGLELAFWLAPRDDGREILRYRALANLGIPAEIVDEPLFGTSEARIAAPTAMRHVSWPPTVGDCRIFEETITLDRMGRVGFCPSDRDSTDLLGNLFAQDPGRLLFRKGRVWDRPGRMALCAGCRAHGRFAWPKRISAAAELTLKAGRACRGDAPWDAQTLADFETYDLCALPEAGRTAALDAFRKRLNDWAALQGDGEAASEGEDALVSVEIPAFKGSWLIQCIESVLFQTSQRWRMYLLWDGGDAVSRQVLEMLDALGHARIRVFFGENRGIARARRFLSEVADEPWILPLDDDDLLASDAVEQFLATAEKRPWSGIIRGRRRFIDETNKLVEMAEWFPFEPRHYMNGMITDLFNHCQPYFISRRAYRQTEGWEGFADFRFAGEDCDIFLKIEEVAPIELLDQVLYYYRLNSRRTSHELKPEGAHEMWRRLADKTIRRIGLPLKRVNEHQPFLYERLPAPLPTKDMIDFIVPFFEANEVELDYPARRPSSSFQAHTRFLDGRETWQQTIEGALFPFDRVELVCASEGPVTGALLFEVIGRDGQSVLACGTAKFEASIANMSRVSIRLDRSTDAADDADILIRLRFLPDRRTYHAIQVLLVGAATPALFMRVFRHHPGHSRASLVRCIASLRACGIDTGAIHVIDAPNSSSVNRNTGLSRCTKPFVCFADDDVELTDPNTFERLLERMHQTGCDMIGPKLLTGDGSLFSADPYFNDLMNPVPKGLGEPDTGQYDYVHEVPWLPSTLMLVRREVAVAVGGFDTDYIGSQMEDIDFCLKARMRNFCSVYDGTVSAIHYNYQRNDCFTENLPRFKARWGNRPDLFRNDISAPD